MRSRLAVAWLPRCTAVADGEKKWRSGCCPEPTVEPPFEAQDKAHSKRPTQEVTDLKESGRGNEERRREARLVKTARHKRIKQVKQKKEIFKGGNGGSKSSIRLDCAEDHNSPRRLVIFCWYFILRSLVSKTSHASSARARSSPFFLEPYPALRTVSHSWPIAVSVPRSAAGRHSSMRIFI
jgi:hypothetical protein